MNDPPGYVVKVSTMIKVIATKRAQEIIIMGHGITVPFEFEISRGIFIDSKKPTLDLKVLTEGCETFYDYAAVLLMENLASFSIKVQRPSGGRDLAADAWNALWQFHLLSLALYSPCFPLYTVSRGETEQYSIANRNLIIRPVSKIVEATEDNLNWVKKHQSSFDSLIKVVRFSRAMRYYGNSHYLFDLDARIMLLWAGIESLLDVDAELSRRLALYAALMFDGKVEEKRAYFETVKAAYNVRSRVVHGSTPKTDKLQEGYETASLILARLLAKCVEIGRVPTPKDLDNLAIAQSL